MNWRPMLLSGSYAVFPGGIFRFAQTGSNDYSLTASGETERYRLRLFNSRWTFNFLMG